MDDAGELQLVFVFFVLLFFAVLARLGFCSDIPTDTWKPHLVC